MLSIALLFYPMAIEGGLLDTVKNRLGDKYEKLQNLDE